MALKPNTTNQIHYFEICYLAHLNMMLKHELLWYICHTLLVKKAFYVEISDSFSFKLAQNLINFCKCGLLLVKWAQKISSANMFFRFLMKLGFGFRVYIYNRLKGIEMGLGWSKQIWSKLRKVGYRIKWCLHLIRFLYQWNIKQVSANTYICDWYYWSQVAIPEDPFSLAALMKD